MRTARVGSMMVLQRSPVGLEYALGAEEIYTVRDGRSGAQLGEVAVKGRAQALVCTCPVADCAHRRAVSMMLRAQATST